jgi:hypothetical protein
VKLFLLFLLLPIVVLAGSESEKQIPQKPTNWVPIYGFKHPTSKAFVDSNSVSRKLSESGGDYGSGSILLISAEPVPIPLAGKIIFAKSIVKHLVADCKSGLLAPAVDFFFAIDFPTRKDKPLGALKYNDLTGVEEIPKSSLIYKTLCPVYI